MTHAVGNCYEANGALFVKRALFPGSEDLRLCHGTVVGTGGAVEGVAYGHAWVETPDGELVFDVSNGRDVTMSRADYYRAGTVHERTVRRYEPEEARRLLLAFGHWGPWEEPDYDVPEAHANETELTFEED